MNSKGPIIQVRHLTSRYHNRTILDDISFDVYRGEIFMIVGGSGTGKTTLLNQLIGLLTPDSGEILINGHNLATANEKERINILKTIGVMYQSGALFGSMNLLENVSVPLEQLTDLSKEAIEIIARNKLEWVGLGDFCHYMPDEISGGMKKRASLARAIALDPEILFLDEPSSGLDPSTSAQLDQLITHLSKTLGITFVIVSHELEGIKAIAEHLIMLDKGKIIADGSPETLRKEHDNVLLQKFFKREA